MSDDELSLSSSESLNTRIKKKVKTELLKVMITPNTDITELALNNYETLKKNYNFVSFDDVKNSKANIVGEYENYNIPIHDFNEEMYLFKKNGYCTNPNSEVKDYVFGEKQSKL